MPNISRDAEVLPSGDDLRATDEWKQDQREQAPQHNFSIWLYDGPYKLPFVASCREVAFPEAEGGLGGPARYFPERPSASQWRSPRTGRDPSRTTLTRLVPCIL